MAGSRSSPPGWRGCRAASSAAAGGCCVRYSGTENIARVMVEGEDDGRSSASRSPSRRRLAAGIAHRVRTSSWATEGYQCCSRCTMPLRRPSTGSRAAGALHRGRCPAAAREISWRSRRRRPLRRREGLRRCGGGEGRGATKVLESIQPAQQFVKIVHDELARVLGGSAVPFRLRVHAAARRAAGGPAGERQDHHGRALRAAVQAGRPPAAPRPRRLPSPRGVEQLRVLAKEAGVDCWPTDAGDKAVKVVKEALKHAEKIGYDTIIIDTAGRLHVDEEMMEEVRDIAPEGGAAAHPLRRRRDDRPGRGASARPSTRAMPITGVVLTSSTATRAAARPSRSAR